ncbi:hypothetical protein HN51_017375 [Arachis hypogaea]
MAIITTLCSVRFRRKKASKESQNPTGTSPLMNVTSPDRTTEAGSGAVSPDRPQMSNFTVKTNNKDNNLLEKELHLSPTKLETKESKSFHMKNAISKRLSFNVSLKLPKSLSIAKNHDGNDNGKKTDNLKKDDAVWMKTIILGEKCNPDEEEEEIIYEEGKGRRMSFSAYHPRMSLSN